MGGAPMFTLDNAVHLVQVALSPIFLLSGIAALLNVFAGRLARVADRLEALAPDACRRDLSLKENEEVARLHRRTVVLDVAVVLSTAGAALTCLAILTLFLFAVSNKIIGDVLLFCFGTAIVCTLGSVGAFGAEMLMSSRELRSRMHFHVPALTEILKRK
jgi:hypothetical protein